VDATETIARKTPSLMARPSLARVTPFSHGPAHPRSDHAMDFESDVAARTISDGAETVRAVVTAPHNRVRVS
jgi:hypothetical protein